MRDVTKMERIGRSLSLPHSQLMIPRCSLPYPRTWPRLEPRASSELTGDDWAGKGTESSGCDLEDGTERTDSGEIHPYGWTS